MVDIPRMRCTFIPLSICELLRFELYQRLYIMRVLKFLTYRYMVTSGEVSTNVYICI